MCVCVCKITWREGGEGGREGGCDELLRLLPSSLTARLIFHVKLTLI